MSIHRPQRNWGCRIHEIDWYGISTVVLENELVRLSFLAGKGTDLVEFSYKPLDLDFAWLTNAGIRNPHALAASSPDAEMSFLDTYPGGWQEIFPNAGEPSRGNGAAWGQHGEVYALPWDVAIDTDTEDEIAVRFTVRGVRSPCILTKIVRVVSGVPGLRFEETVVNPSPDTIDVMWGHHITFGKPFLVPGARIVLPDSVVAMPHDGDLWEERRSGSGETFGWPIGTNADGNTEDFSIVPDPGTPSELLYLSGFSGGVGTYDILRPGDDIGMRVTWDAETLPYLWYWQEFGRAGGYPWYGTSYNIGLEPSSSYPTTGLEDAIANGSAMRLGPGETRSLWLTAGVIGGES